MRNPILKQEAPNISTSDLKFLLKQANAGLERAINQTELMTETVQILVDELKSRT